MIIAIDGPAGSGKSTIAKLVAKRLNYRYIDTGVMYRAVAWTAERKGISLADESAMAKIAQSLKIEFVPSAEGQKVKVDGKDTGALLKNETVGRGAATVAAQKFVREVLVDLPILREQISVQQQWLRHVLQFHFLKELQYLYHRPSPFDLQH